MKSLRNTVSAPHKKLVVYLTAGFPNAKTFLEVCTACVENGVDILEIGIPFSDPGADGPVIQISSQHMLDAGLHSLEQVADLTSKVRATTGVPVVWMGYLNPFLRCGLPQGIAMAASSGVEGFIVPDLPLEEAEPFLTTLQDESKKSGTELSWIPLLASTTRSDRALAMLQKAQAFAYYVAIKGVTGVRDSYPEGWQVPLYSFARLHKTPLFVGFGVCSPSLARECVRYAQGVIIGSKILQIVMDAGPEQAAVEVGSFVRSIRQAIDSI